MTRVTSKRVSKASPVVEAIKIQIDDERISVDSGTAPEAATAGSAGIDLRACADDSKIAIAPGRVKIVACGLRVAIPEGYVGLMMIRSSLAVKRGVVLANGTGVIDSDYRGPLMIALHNTTRQPVIVNDLERVAQLLVVPHACCDNIEFVDSLGDTERGEGGLGSTGTD